ncbi:PAS domain S-box protein [Thermoleptolyngbya sichuanensis A183]|uniref:PAS domain S-box protein n=1 Tax=Thermoleptolyngbya sichuanensis A183 TaxID=2737172 RepID=A0A6M8BHA3_9CYAN|nr:PAS domain S-box protein [Thermoleptolyngbya sichuanensis]QKD82533.1 PAS domain S-box protein [Thermoleptolyngbya sichuanensis A183]
MRCFLQQVCEAGEWALGVCWLPQDPLEHQGWAASWIRPLTAQDGSVEPEVPAVPTLDMPVTEGVSVTDLPITDLPVVDLPITDLLGRAGVALLERAWNHRQAEWIVDLTKRPPEAREESPVPATQPNPAVAPSLAPNLAQNLAQNIALTGVPNWRSALAVPVMESDRPLAVLLFASRDARDEDSQVVQLMRAIAAQLGAVIQVRQTEATLRQNESRFRAVFEHANISIGMTALDGRIIDVNAASTQLFGYSREEFYRMNFKDYTHPEDLEIDLDLLQDMIEGRRNHYQLEKRYIRKDGSIFWANLTVCAVRDEQGALQFTFAIVEDITNRKQAEDALRQSETLNRNLLRALPEMLFIVDRQGTCLHIQTEQDDDLVCPLSDQLGRQIEELLPAEVAQSMMRAIAQAAQTGTVQTLEYSLLLQGEERCFEARIADCGPESLQSSNQILDNRLGNLFACSLNSPTGCQASDPIFIVSVRNITQRKRTERALREQEAFLRLIIDNIPQHVFWKDCNLIYRGGNRNFAHSAGFERPEDLVGKSDHDLWPTDQADRYVASDREVLATGQAKLHMVRKKVLADGREIWQDASKVPIRDADGKIIGILGSYDDTTERKQAEEALAQREQYLATLVDVQQQLLSLDNPAKIYALVSQRLGQISGTSRVYVFENSRDSDGNLRMHYVHEWCAEGISPNIDRPLLKGLRYLDYSTQFEQVLSEGRPYAGIVAELSASERAVLEPQGVLSLLVLPLQVNGEFFGFIGFSNCVEAKAWTAAEVGLLRAAAAAVSLALERAQAAEALRQSESRYRLLAEHATDLISVHAPDGTYRYASPACQALLGYRPEDLVGRSLADLLHPQDCESLLNTALPQSPSQSPPQSPLQSLLLNRGPVVYRIRHAKGHYIWFETRSKALCDPATQQVLEIIAVSRDITERKQAEQLLAGQKRVLEKIATGADLTETLKLLLQVMESQADGLIGSILLLDATGQRIEGGITNSLPDTYVEQLIGVQIGPKVGSCGTAMYRRSPVITPDLYQDPLWEDYRDFARQFGLVSCWSLPILSSQGSVLGSIAIHSRTPRTPTATDWSLLEISAPLAGIAIEQARADAALQAAEAKYRGIFENAVEGIFQSTPDGQYLMVNPMLARLYGYESPADLVANLTNIGQQLYVDPQRRAEFVRLMQTVGTVQGFESEVYRKDGSIIWISESARALYDAAGNLIRFEGTVENITRRKRAELELLNRDNLLQGVAQAANCLLTHEDLSTAISEAIAILGTMARVDRVFIAENHPHETTGEMAMSVRYEWVRKGTVPCLSDWQNQPYAAHGLGRWYEQFLLGKSVGGIARELPRVEQDVLAAVRVLSSLMVPIFIEDEFWGYIGLDDCHAERQWSASDESSLRAIAASLGGAIKRQRTEEKMRYQAFHDALTGLPNRMMFNRHLYLMLARSRRGKEPFAVVFLDLDRFKTINDTLGHTVGDRLLEQATQRLTYCLREEDIIARWGGDEFTLLLPNLKSPQDASRIAERISENLRPPFYVDSHELHITCSMGIALFPEHGTDAQTLLKNADAALYLAKGHGRDNHQFYTPAITSQSTERLALDSSLHYALKRQEFTLHYQPQVNVLTGEIIQMEALLRWTHPKLGLISPQTFIGLAEENGLIVPIGFWVLRTACLQNKQWQEAGFGPLRVAVNLSARQFQQPNLVGAIASILEETGLPPTGLELEITETAAMQNVEFTTTLLHELQDMGVRIAMDDFGTGYSSLGYLKQFPLNTLKIDRSFVKDVTANPDDAAIVAAIVALGQGLNLNVVAEGVETIDQLAKLRSLQCEEMQGNLFSRPLDAATATQFLQKNQPRSNLQRFCQPFDRSG